MDENSNWHLWRAKGLGASDAPIVMGVSPWKTRYQLWMEKTGQVESDKAGNWATRRGHELEPKARACYELELGYAAPPRLVEHADFPFIRASLDGFNEDHSVVLEIKCPGKDDHDLALNGKVPEKYWPQLQHQLLVTGAKSAHYYSFDGENGVVVRVAPDQQYCVKLLFELTKFWELVQLKTPPEMTSKDFIKTNDPHLEDLIEIYKETSKRIEFLEKQLTETRERILDSATFLKHKNLQCNGMSVQEISRKGNIDYAKIPELAQIDLEQYRKKETKFVQIKLIKP